MTANFKNTPLPEDVTWHTEGWQGALLMYESLVHTSNPKQKLLHYLQTPCEAGARSMT